MVPAPQKQPDVTAEGAMADKINPSAAAVYAKLKETWRRERRAAHLQGGAIFLMWLAALAVVDLLVDWLFKLPGYGRFALLLLNLGTLGFVAYRRWYAHLRGFDPVRYALKVEALHPELESLLVSFVQFDGDADDRAVSPALVEAMKRRALEETAPLDFKHVIDLREVKRIAAFGCCVLLLFGLASLNWSGYFRVMMIRLFNPLADAAYPTRTRIDSVTGNLRVKQGDKLEIRVAVSGVTPREGVLRVLPEGGKNWEEISLVRSGDREFAYLQGQAYRSFTYQAALGDAATDSYRVEVIPPPTVIEAKIKIAPPAYSGRPIRIADALNLTDVYEGSEVEWTLTLNYPLAKAEFLIDGKEPAAFALSADGRTITCKRKPDESFTYHLRYSRRDYAEYAYLDEVRYMLQLVPDAPPRAEMLRPTRDQKATVAKKLRLDLRAEDDNQVREVWVVYNVNDGDDVKEKLDEPGQRLVEKSYVWDVAKSIPGLKIGDTVAYRLQVADNYPGKDGAYAAASAAQRLFIVSIPDYMQWVFEERERLTKTLQDIRKDEEAGGKEVDALMQHR